MGHTLTTGTGRFPQTYIHLALSLPAKSSRSISIAMLIKPWLLASYSEIRPSNGRWIDFSNACRNVPPTWTETSYSYSVCRDVNTHTGIERCVMYRSSFRTFPSFLNPRAHSAHNTWTTLWSFRSFSSKTHSSFILSTITEEWKFSYRIFTYIQNEISFLNCPCKLHS